MTWKAPSIDCERAAQFQTPHLSQDPARLLARDPCPCSVQLVLLLSIAAPEKKQSGCISTRVHSRKGLHHCNISSYGARTLTGSFGRAERRRIRSWRSRFSTASKQSRPPLRTWFWKSRRAASGTNARSAAPEVALSPDGCRLVCYRARLCAEGGRRGLRGAVLLFAHSAAAGCIRGGVRECLKRREPLASVAFLDTRKGSAL